MIVNCHIEYDFIYSLLRTEEEHNSINNFLGPELNLLELDSYEKDRSICNSYVKTIHGKSQATLRQLVIRRWGAKGTCKYCDKNFPLDPETKKHIKKRMTGHNAFMADCGKSERILRYHERANHPNELFKKDTILYKSPRWKEFIEAYHVLFNDCPTKEMDGLEAISAMNKFIKGCERNILLDISKTTTSREVGVLLKEKLRTQWNIS